MAAQKLLLACLLGSVAVSCLAAGEGKQTQLFADWLHQKRPGKAGLASYYSAAEVQDVCMREHKVDGCSCYGRRQEKHCCYSGNVDTDMTCCHGKADKFKGLEKMKEEIISTGKCSYTQMYLEKPVDINEYDSTVRKVGTFTGICTMSKDSDVCGDPACDGMSVTIQGDILRADNVAFEGRPVNALRSESCERLFKGDCDADSKDADGKVAPKKAHIASYGYGGRPSEHSNFYEPKYPSYGGSKGKYEPKYEEPKYGKYDSKGPKYEEHHDDHHDSNHGDSSRGYYGDKDSKHDEDKYGSKHGEDRYYGSGDSKHEEKYYEEPKHEEKYEEKYEEDKHDYYDDKKIKYYKGSGEVFMGTFYTVNRIHDSKSYSGVYQSVIVVDVDTDKPLEHAPEGAYVARPNEVYFRFVKSGSAEPYKA